MNYGAETYTGFKPFTLGNGDFLKIKGCYFLVKDESIIGKSFYYYNTLIDDNILYNSIPYNSFYEGQRLLEYYDLNSTDEEYLKEVSKIKSIFNTNPNGTFKARKVMTYYRFYNINHWEYVDFSIIVFDFYSVFLDSYDLYSYSSNIMIDKNNVSAFMNINPFNKYLDYKFTELDLNYPDSPSNSSFNNILNDSVTRFGNLFGTPTFIDEFGTIYGVKIGSRLFYRDGIFYYFHCFKPPVFAGINYPVLGEWKVYTIPIVKKCCLAECFGITE